MNKIPRRDYKKRGRSAAVFTAASVLAGIASALLAVYIISLLWEGGGFTELLLPAIGIMACQLIKAACYAAALWKAHDFAYSSLLNIRLALIDKLKKLPLSFFQRHKSGELAGIIDHDVERVELYLAHTLPEITVTYLVCALSLAAIFVLDWRMGFSLIAALPLVFIIMAAASPLWKSSINAYQDSMRAVSENIMEYISTIPVIKVFAKGERKTEKVLASMDDYIKKAKKSIYLQAAPMGLVTVLMETGIVVAAVVGARILQSKSITAFDVTRFVFAIILAGNFTKNSLKAVVLMFNTTVYKNTMKAVDGIMDEPVPPEPEAQTAAQAAVQAGDIVFDHVSFSYEGDAEALADLSVVFKQNATSAIVGPSGAGKSTVAGLLLGLWRHDAGSITIAGNSLENIPEKELTALISVVQQENFLLNISMADNIRIGKPDASDEEIIAAAKKAQIHETIMKLPGGYQALAGEGGAKLSGGEKQRVSLARMILKDSPIVILDEATAAIDPYNEALIQKAISALCRDKTLIVVAHRLNTIVGAAQIVVLNHGRVEARGKHEELFSGCELYRSMVEAQRAAQNWNIRGVAV
jgi:ATP-binding cassette subfamily B protein